MPYVYNEDTGNYDYIPDDTTGVDRLHNPAEDVVWTPGLVADLANGEQNLPAPNTNNNNNNNGGGTVNPWYDTSKPPPSEWLARGFHWVWNAGRGIWEQRDDTGGNGTVIGTGKGGNVGAYGGWQMAPFGGGSYAFPLLELPTPPTLDPYVPEEWKAPDPNDVYNDPSYQFRFNEGMRPIETSRAAQGLTRTGATLKALSRYGQNFA